MRGASRKETFFLKEYHIIRKSYLFLRKVKKSYEKRPDLESQDPKEHFHGKKKQEK